MRTNTQQPREAVIQAFHHQQALDWQNNPPNGWVYSPVRRPQSCSESVKLAAEVTRATLAASPRLPPLEVRAGYNRESRGKLLGWILFAGCWLAYQIWRLQ